MGGRRQRWGWHQLHPRWAHRVVAEADISPGDVVVDIGAGRGALTAHLLETGARVIAVEQHPDRARHLRTQFGDTAVIVQADATDLRLPRKPYRVVANPPFSVTTPLLRRLLQPGSRLLSAHLILQEQAARRWMDPRAPGARRWRQTFEITPGPRLPRSAFRPPPQVDARLVVIRRRPGT